MSRIKDAVSRNPIVKLCYMGSRRQLGKVVKPLKVMAHHPKIMAGFAVMETMFLFSKSVDHALKDLCQLRVATLIGCPF